MIYFRDNISDEGKALFISSKVTFRYINRNNEYANSKLGPHFSDQDLVEVSRILGPKELSYWDES